MNLVASTVQHLALSVEGQTFRAHRTPSKRAGVQRGGCGTGPFVAEPVTSQQLLAASLEVFCRPADPKVFMQMVAALPSGLPRFGSVSNEQTSRSVRLLAPSSQSLS